MLDKKPKIAWVSTWNRLCGIADYSKALWPKISSLLESQGHEALLVSLDEYSTTSALRKKLVGSAPDLIHFQHEYGIFGGKNPPFYRFPSFLRKLKTELPKTALIATAHTVLPTNYRFPLKGKSVGIPFRAFANTFLLPGLSKTWSVRTWGGLDACIVHSKYQIQDVLSSGCSFVQEIPHFVPESVTKGTFPRQKGLPTILVFGFFTPEKGQDLAIDALSLLQKKYRLILAGGLRRKKDQSYLKSCKQKIKDLGLSSQIEITGYIDSQKLDGLFSQASLVLAPFRETTGSGSLAQALARECPVLTSDLPLNLEIAERTADALSFFRSGDPKDCAIQIQNLLENPERVRRLREGARKYAVLYSPEKTAEKHLELYRSVFPKN